MFLKKLLALAAAVALAGAVCCGCGKSGSDPAGSKEVSEGSSGEQAEEKLPETDEEWNKAMIDKSMTSYGNTTRMMNKIKKAQSGEDVTVAYIGGSITEGLTAGPDGCYAKLSCDYFAEKFGTGENVNYINAGLSGTPSKLGVLRLDRDVLQHEPDIVFIEFAVNDGSDPDYQGAYESMVRRLLSDDNEIAVVLLMAITEEGHTAQDYMKKIGEYYSLPVISYADALTFMFENGKMKWSDFSDDQSHPNAGGHKLVCDMIANYYNTVADQPQEAEPPLPAEPVFSSRQETAELLESDQLVPESLGSFIEGTTISGFKNGWRYNDDGSGQPAVFNISGKFLYMIFKENSTGDLGTAHVTIKCGGEVVSEKDVSGIRPGGWGDPGIEILVMGVESKDYTIEVKMADGSKGKQFEILAFAYT